jgi:hypothetical protein
MGMFSRPYLMPIMSPFLAYAAIAERGRDVPLSIGRILMALASIAVGALCLWYLNTITKVEIDESVDAKS